jgi:crossover junction endodeoxyribonuclease RuvC
MTASVTRVLGIDPGLQRTGFGVIEVQGAQLAYVASGTISTTEADRGHGLASKSQIQEMVMRLLKLPGLPGKDAADALGLAITHAHAARSFAALAQATPLARRAHAQYKKGRTY